MTKKGRLGKIAGGKTKAAFPPRVIKFNGTIYLLPGTVEDDQKIEKLFSEFKLDIENLQHWRQLLVLFSEKHFEKGRGRPVTWSSEKSRRLVALWFALIKDGKIKERMSYAKIAALMKPDLDHIDPLHKVSQTEIAKRLAIEMRALEERVMPEQFAIKSDLKKSRPPRKR